MKNRFPDRYSQHKTLGKSARYCYRSLSADVLLWGFGNCNCKASSEDSLQTKINESED